MPLCLIYQLNITEGKPKENKNPGSKKIYNIGFVRVIIHLNGYFTMAFLLCVHAITTRANAH